jgi:DNA helicase-2/ATP-dependent DNA helicase PcrA
LRGEGWGEGGLSQNRHFNKPHWAGDDDFDQTFDTPSSMGGGLGRGGVQVEPHFSQDPGDGVWKIGMKVRHPQFGEGVIRRIEGKDERTKLTIYFGPHIVKTLMVQYAQLSPV